MGKIWNDSVIYRKEDEILRSCVEIYGPHSWTKLSQDFFKISGVLRTPKQCRDRWFNSAKKKERSKVGKTDFHNIVSLFKIYGPQWSRLSEMIPNFTENEIKNLINSTIRRNIRRYNKHKSEEEKILSNSVNLINISKLRPLLLKRKSKNQAWFDSYFLNQETLIMAKSLKSPNKTDQELVLDPIPESPPHMYSFTYPEEETDLPCEDLLSLLFNETWALAIKCFISTRVSNNLKASFKDL